MNSQEKIFFKRLEEVLKNKLNWDKYYDYSDETDLPWENKPFWVNQNLYIPKELNDLLRRFRKVFLKERDIVLGRYDGAIRMIPHYLFTYGIFFDSDKSLLKALVIPSLDIELEDYDSVDEIIESCYMSAILNKIDIALEPKYSVGSISNYTNPNGEQIIKQSTRIITCMELKFSEKSINFDNLKADIVEELVEKIATQIEKESHRHFGVLNELLKYYEELYHDLEPYSEECFRDPNPEFMDYDDAELKAYAEEQCKLQKNFEVEDLEDELLRETNDW